LACAPGLGHHLGDAADHRDIDQAVGGICRGLDDDHRDPAFAHGSLGGQPDCGFVDAVGKAHGADGEARKRLRKQSFCAAIERLRVQNDVARAVRTPKERLGYPVDFARFAILSPTRLHL
jgi:hypothetical protein